MLRAITATVSFAVLFLPRTALAGESPRPHWSKVAVGHLFMQPNASAAVDLLGDAGARQVNDYDIETLGAVPEAAIDGLARAAEARHLEFSVHDDYDIVQLPGGKIDARLGTLKSNPGKTLGKPYPPGEYGLYVVQFAGLIRKDWVNRLRALEIVPVQYIPLNAYLVAGTPENLARAADLDFVQFVDLYQPFLKVAWLPESESADAYVEMSTAPGSESLVEALRKRSTSAITTESLGPLLQRVRGRFKTADRDVLLAEPLVIAIYEVPHDALSDERVALAVAGKIGIDGLPQDPKSYKTWLANMCEYCGNLQNDGFWIGLADTGLDSGNGTEGRGTVHHPDLPVSRVFYATDFNFGHNTPSFNTTDLSDDFSHGTMVTGVAAGNPIPGASGDGNGFYYGSGIAPTAGLLITKNFQPQADDTKSTTPIDLSAPDARNPSSRTPAGGPTAYIQNHSHNQYNISNFCSDNYDGLYSSLSRDYDLAVLDSQFGTPASHAATQITLTISSGNIHQQQKNCGQDLRATLPPATGKNVIAIGAAENPRSSQWSCFGIPSNSFTNTSVDSKHGTIKAGWFKPDLMAPAVSIASAETTIASATTYCFTQGPSYSDPSESYTPVAGSYFGLSPMSYTDPVLATGVTPIRAIHLAQLRSGAQ